MAQPVNLNRFRKQKARAEKTARADANSVKFGRSKAEKLAEDQDRTRADRKLDGHKIDE